MKKGQVEKAERLALNEFDKWNDCTGVIPEGSGYYYEVQDCILDAVHIGIQMALLGKVRYDEDDNVDRSGKIKIKS
jgi:hypothetical protein